MNRVFNLPVMFGGAGRVALVLMFLTLGILAWLIFFEPPWLVYSNLPFPVRTPVVHPGSPILMDVSRCSSATQTRVYIVSHRLINVRDNTVYILPATTASIEPGCNTVVSSVNIVPKGAPPGRYRVSGFGEIQGIIRTSLVSWQSEDFDVED